MAYVNNNTRVFYATQAVAIGGINAAAVRDSNTYTDDPTVATTGSVHIAHGVQSIGIDTNFNLEQAFELGQLSLYENIEDIPDVNVTLQKVLDGYSLLYHLGASTDPEGNGIAPTKTTLVGRGDSRCDLRMVINSSSDEAVNSGDAAVTELYCSGMYVSSISYTIPTDGNCVEDMTLVGNNKAWYSESGSDLLLIDAALSSQSGIVDGQFGAIFGNDQPAYVGGCSGNILRREDVCVSGDDVRGYQTLLPTVIQGVLPLDNITINGATQRAVRNAGPLNTKNTHIQSFTCSVDLGREQINQLGTRSPYSRYVDFPTEVTSNIEVIATAGDNITALENNRCNLDNHEICMVLKDSTVLHLGKNNKVSSVTYGGGDAGGGNASITYTFSNFNDMVVLHSGDPIRGNEGAYWNDKFKD